jgi:hypothetical protein
MQLLVLLVILISSTSQANYSELIKKEAKKQGIEPKLALAIAMVESGMNPKALGAKGEVGLFQLRPELHPKTQLLNPSVNIKLGIEQLKFWQKNCPVTEKYSWITCYNQGNRKPKYPTILPYYKKVMKEYRG